MVIVGLAMLRPKAAGGDPDVQIDRRMAGRLAGIGLVTGMVSGFFGIGGGFLIVPGIMLGSGMPMLYAIGSSLFAVGRSEEHTSELQSLMRISYAVFCLKKKK